MIYFLSSGFLKKMSLCHYDPWTIMTNKKGDLKLISHQLEELPSRSHFLLVNKVSLQLASWLWLDIILIKNNEIEIDWIGATHENKPLHATLNKIMKSQADDHVVKILSQWFLTKVQGSCIKKICCIVRLVLAAFRWQLWRRPFHDWPKRTFHM